MLLTLTSRRRVFTRSLRTIDSLTVFCPIAELEADRPGRSPTIALTNQPVNHQ